MTPPRHRELFVLFHWSMQFQWHTSVGVESRQQTPDSQRHLPVWNDTWHQTVEYVACLPCQTRFRKARCQMTCHLQLLASYCITDTTNISQCANNWTCSSADNKKQAEVASLQITETHDSLYNKITDAHYSSVSVSIGSYIYIYCHLPVNTTCITRITSICQNHHWHSSHCRLVMSTYYSQRIQLQQLEHAGRTASGTNFANLYQSLCKLQQTALVKCNSNTDK